MEINDTQIQAYKKGDIYQIHKKIHLTCSQNDKLENVEEINTFDPLHGIRFCNINPQGVPIETTPFLTLSDEGDTYCKIYKTLLKPNDNNKANLKPTLIDIILGFYAPKNNEGVITIELEMAGEFIWQCVIEPGNFKYIIEDSYFFPLISLQFDKIEAKINYENKNDKIFAIYCDLTMKTDCRKKLAQLAHEFLITSKRSLIRIMAGKYGSYKIPEGEFGDELYNRANGKRTVHFFTNMRLFNI